MVLSLNSLAQPVPQPAPSVEPPEATARCRPPAGLTLKRSNPVAANAKWSFVTRNLVREDVAEVLPVADRAPQPGDLLVAQVTKVAQHTKIQLSGGRRSQLFVGDELVLAYANRYAPDQFEAEVPADLSRCHLVAAGGIASQALSKNARLKWPTELQPDGYLLDREGTVINLSRYALEAPTAASPKPVIGVAGTSMNAGKTTVMASLVRGLSAAGLGVAALKVTGTGAGNDLWAYQDAGAALALDFTDAGHASTYRAPAEAIEACLARLVGIASGSADVDVVLVEVADGLLHPESLALIESPTFRSLDARVVFAAGEAMGAMAGAEMLRARGVNVAGISGVLSASELASQEAGRATGLTVFTRDELAHASIRRWLF